MHLISAGNLFLGPSFWFHAHNRTLSIVASTGYDCGRIVVQEGTKTVYNSRMDGPSFRLMIVIAVFIALLFVLALPDEVTYMPNPWVPPPTDSR